MPSQRAEKHQFGTFGGVFTPCILTILGVIMFMRAGFVVGQGGILYAMVILVMAKAISLFTVLSASAIGTNMRVRGGGAYFLISRVLGAEFGGAIGVMLFLAVAASVPFYVLGFTEALVETVPEWQRYYRPIAYGTAAALFVVTWIGAGWAIRVQYLVMAILFLAILSFTVGALALFDSNTFAQNLGAHFGHIDPGNPDTPKYSFWAVFAIYFPAVTGIMAGVNMSGDLKDPGKSIPRGTLAAVLVGFGVYLLQIIAAGGAFDRESLLAQPFVTLKDNAWLASGALVTAGMFAASLSSALGSFMGAPRVLQALARDEILPLFGPFRVGSGKNDEPRRALLLTGVITFLIILWATEGGAGKQAFNLVAQVITEFFLVTYGVLNLAAFVEGLGKNPSFRPQFRFFHWSTALVGAVGCIGVSFIISPASAAVSYVLLGALILYVKRRQFESKFGSVWGGFLYGNVRNDLLRLAGMPPTPKNWRPTCLVFSGNPNMRATLVHFGEWLVADRGLLYLVEILDGDFTEYSKRQPAAQQRLRQFCEERDIEAFPVVVVEESVRRGAATAMQSIQIGPLRPNMVLFGWPGAPDPKETVLPALFRVGRALDMSLCVVRPGHTANRAGTRQIDVWWRGMKNGNLMLLLAHMLSTNWEWQQSRIRLLRVVEREQAREGTLKDMQNILDEARVRAEPVVLVRESRFAAVLREESGSADAVFLGFNPPEEEEDAERQWLSLYGGLVFDGPTFILVSASGQEDVMA